MFYLLLLKLFLLSEPYYSPPRISREAAIYSYVKWVVEDIVALADPPNDIRNQETWQSKQRKLREIQHSIRNLCERLQQSSC